MASRKRPAAGLTGIRQRDGKFQIRIFGGIDPATGEQVIHTGSAPTQDAAIALRDGFRQQLRDRTAVRTAATLRFLLAEWLAGHQVEQSTRATYALLIDRFINPALGDETLTKLAKLGPRPCEQHVHGRDRRAFRRQGGDQGRETGSAVGGACCSWRRTSASSDGPARLPPSDHRNTDGSILLS